MLVQDNLKNTFLSPVVVRYLIIIQVINGVITDCCYIVYKISFFFSIWESRQCWRRKNLKFVQKKNMKWVLWVSLSRCNAHTILFEKLFYHYIIICPSFIRRNEYTVIFRVVGSYPSAMRIQLLIYLIIFIIVFWCVLREFITFIQFQAHHHLCNICLFKEMTK